MPIRVSVDHPSGYDVVGYKFMVKTCLYNLVGNSAKFTTNGHIELYASVVHDAGAHSHTNGPHNATSKSPNNKALGAARLHVTVEDTGRGIPEEKRAKLFAFGEQVHAGDSGAGSGLGLAFVHRACSELFHSSPIVESQVGGRRSGVGRAWVGRGAARGLSMVLHELTFTRTPTARDLN